MAAPRAIQSLTISFGLVSIPVKLYTAASSLSVRFNMLNKETGARVKQQLIDPTTDAAVERKDTVKGYEYAKGQYVVFADDELKQLEASKSSALDINEFVPADSVDAIYFEKGYFAGPDKGGHKAFGLLVAAMRRSSCFAVGQFTARGKEQLAILRPYRAGLMLHQLYYADEVRSIDDLELEEMPAPRPGEAELADQLIIQLTSPAFEPERYADQFRQRVLEAVEQKVAGEQVAVAPAAPQAEIIDLFDALKASLAADAAAKEPAPAARKAKGIKKTTPERAAAAKKPAAKGPKRAVPKTSSGRGKDKKRSAS